MKKPFRDICTKHFRGRYRITDTVSMILVTASAVMCTFTVPIVFTEENDVHGVCVVGSYCSILY